MYVDTVFWELKPCPNGGQLMAFWTNTSSLHTDDGDSMNSETSVPVHQSTWLDMSEGHTRSCPGVSSSLGKGTEHLLWTGSRVARVKTLVSGRVETESGGTRRRTGGEVKGKEANGVGSQQSSA